MSVKEAVEERAAIEATIEKLVTDYSQKYGLYVRDVIVYPVEIPLANEAVRKFAYKVGVDVGLRATFRLDRENAGNDGIL